MPARTRTPSPALSATRSLSSASPSGSTRPRCGSATAFVARSTTASVPSRFGVVIFSDSFFRNGWTNHELDGLVTRTVAGEQSLLPIWHDLTADRIMAYSPSLAGKMAMSTSEYSIEDIAGQIAEVINDSD